MICDTVKAEVGTLSCARNTLLK